MRRIKSLVMQLTRKYKTFCPYQLAEFLKIEIYFLPLGKVLGFFHVHRRIPSIFVNSDLDSYHFRRFVCAHELGHAVLHRGLNTPFMSAYTLFSVDKIEQEANKFAVELLLPDHIVREYCTLFDAAKAHGIPAEVILLKRY